MNKSTYLVKVTAGKSDSSRVWNSRKPLIVGHPLKWVLSQEEGGVRVKSLAPSLEGTKDQFLKNSEIEKSASITLTSGSKDSGGLKLELRPVSSASPAYKPEEVSRGTSLRIFFCKGDWAIDSTELQSKYTARIDSKPVFKLKGTASGVYAYGQTIELQVLSEGLKMGSGELRKGDRRAIPFSELSGTTFTYGGSEWKMMAFQKEASPFLVAPQVNDGESTLFKRTLQGALAACLLAGLITWFIPASEPVKETKVRILLTKKKTVHGFMAAAPKGDPHAADLSIGKSGNAHHAGKKGTQASKARLVAPSGAVAHASPAHRKADQKKVAKAVSKSSKKTASHSTPKKNTKVASHPVHRQTATPTLAPHSELFKALSSASFQKAAHGLVAGGASHSSSSGDSAAQARRLENGSSGGSNSLGSAGGVATRSASVSGFGGGSPGAGDGGPGSSAGYGRGSYSKVSGQGRSFVSMDTGASDVDEGLTRDQVGRVIHSHMNEIRYCYESAVLRSPEIGGRMMVKFAIGAPGNVQTAGVGSSTIGNSRLHDCIVSHLKSWTFPKPKGGVTVAVAYPFMFKTLTR